MDAPDFVVGTGVATSAVAGAAHDALLEDGLHYHGVGRGAEGTDRLREAMIGQREKRKGKSRCTSALSSAVRRGEASLLASHTWRACAAPTRASAHALADFAVPVPAGCGTHRIIEQIPALHCSEHLGTLQTGGLIQVGGHSALKPGLLLPLGLRKRNTRSHKSGRHNRCKPFRNRPISQNAQTQTCAAFPP